MMNECLQKRFRGPAGSLGPLARLFSWLGRVVRSGRWPSRTGPSASSLELRLADRLSLGPRQSLALVEFSGQFLLVSVGGEGAPTVLPSPFFQSAQNDTSDNGKRHRPAGGASNWGPAQSNARTGNVPARLRRPRRLSW